MSFTSGSRPSNPIDVTAKIRYKASEAPATICQDGEWLRIDFDEPQRAVTPGQAVVFYDGDELIGGGIIEVRAPAKLGAAV